MTFSISDTHHYDSQHINKWHNDAQLKDKEKWRKGTQQIDIKHQ